MTPAQAHNTVHLNRSVEDVLDYCERSLGARLAVTMDMSVDRDAKTAHATLFPDAQAHLASSGNILVSFSGSNVIGWVVTVTCSAVGNGTNLQASVVQINDTWLQRKMSTGRLNAFCQRIVGVLLDDLNR